MNYRKFIKNSKAISPIFATLILIAIAVIAGVVVYMFTSGTLATMTGGGTAAQEKVSIQGVQYATAATTISVYAQNMGSGNVVINGLIIKNSVGDIVQSGTITSGATLSASLGTVVATVTAIPAGSYTVTLTTAKGGSFVSSTFVAT